MQPVETLLDKAARLCGSDSELGRRIGVSPQRVNDWRAGRRYPSPEQICRLCLVIDCDGPTCRTYCAHGIADNPKNRAERAELVRALFGPGATGATAPARTKRRPREGHQNNDCRPYRNRANSQTAARIGPFASPSLRSALRAPRKASASAPLSGAVSAARSAQQPNSRTAGRGAARRAQASPSLRSAPSGRPSGGLGARPGRNSRTAPGRLQCHDAGHVVLSSVPTCSRSQGQGATPALRAP